MARVFRDVGLQKPRRFVGGIATIQTGRLEGSGSHAPKFTGQRAQIISHDHFLFSIFRAQTVFKFKQFKWLLLVLRWSQRGHCLADPKDTLEPPKGH